jgi:hypothetical protein
MQTCAKVHFFLTLSNSLLKVSSFFSLVMMTKRMLLFARICDDRKKVKKS